jgi:hypothetical protein
MTEVAEDIILIEGRKDLLLVAPHGHRKDDENTAELTAIAASRLGCRAIVNCLFRKPRGAQRPDPEARLLNLNKSDQAAAHPWFLVALRSVITPADRTLVIWIHGVKDENIEAEAARTKTYSQDPSRLLVLVGYGQGASPKAGDASRYTARPETADRLINLLTANGLTAVAVRNDAPTYRGRNEDYMNQWFRQNDTPLATVESVQLELKYTGVRDPDSLEATATILSDSIKALI